MPASNATNRFSDRVENYVRYRPGYPIEVVRALKTECSSPEYAKGVEMIYSRMYETMKKMGLEPVESVGKQFDPHMHQAVERVETADAEDGIVLAEFQRGYLFKGKMLRPSMVKVASNS